MDAVERLIRYLKIDTESVPDQEKIPSSEKQFDLARLLEKELKEMGVSEVRLDEHCYVYAKIPSNLSGEEKEKTPALGLIAHMDTSPSARGKDVCPRIVKNYDGKDIVLNKDLGITMHVDEFPNLKNYVGKTLITTDGTTLLGADDKSGIVEIIEAVKYLKNHPEIKHGDVRVAFGPDEEIGRGADNFNVKEFNADFAYTMDGGPVGELEYESFNAAEAIFTIKGKSVHPGTAKGKMVNANTIAVELASLFPADEVPEKTEGYEGFYLLERMKTTIEDAELTYILRDHDKEKFLAKKKFAEDVAKKINEKYGEGTVKVSLKDQYYNMGEVIKNHMNVVEIAREAMENLGIKPIIKAIRGGTDGSKISFMGLPTPNIFAGGENFHGKYEFVALESMVQATDTIIEIIKLNEKKR